MNAKKKYETWPFNFGAVDEDFKKAKVVIVPVPYEATTSWQSGTNAGPYAIIEASRYLEELFDTPIVKNNFIFTYDEVVLSKDSPKKAAEGLKQLTEELLSKNKIPVFLGGEHSISLGPVMALKKKYPDLSLLQFDAHLDLRDEYEGTKYGHGCVIRRIKEIGIPIVQVGIRTEGQDEMDYLKKNSTVIFRANEDFDPEEIAQNLTKNVYLTFDLDVLDSSIMPSVGTPEPGGLLWKEAINLLQAAIKDKNIVGADVVELCPIKGFEAPNFLAAKLVYTIINYIYNSKI